MKLFKTFFLLIILGGFFATAIFLWTIFFKIPEFGKFEERKIMESTKIYDRTGKIILYDLHKDARRTTIPFEQIPRNLKNATIAIEDTNFYQHKGVSVFSMFRALATNILSFRIKGQGGSTITQQLVKNTLLTSEKSFTRKIKEAVLALRIEKIYSKDQILNLYFNEIPYGSNNYGVEAASLYFFGKEAKNIDLAESAYLSALPKAPSYYSPYGPHKEELDHRKNIVLERMKDLNFISEEEFETAKRERVAFLNQKEEGIKAPHFVLYIKDELIKKYGEEKIEKGGLKVITTLDSELQDKAEELVKKYAEENEKKFNAYNASMVGIDPKTGQILIMVGSRDWFADSKPVGCVSGVNCQFEPKVNVATFMKGRQPGSSFKPFVYATAFQKGYTPDTVVFDLKTEFNASCNADGTPKTGINKKECYSPSNYDNKFRGPISLRNALAQSINVPSVKTLYLAGIKDSLKTANNLGITTLEGSGRYGLTLVLGGGEVKLLEMTGAYSVFANNGKKNEITGILEIQNKNGRILEQFEKNEEQALDENIAKIISDVLSDNTARAPAFGENSYLYFPGKEVAVKTGTTNDYRDAWVVGYTPNFALGLWVGNNDNTAMVKKVAGFIAAPLWHSVFEEVFKKIQPENFQKPDYNDRPQKPILNGEWRGKIENNHLITQIHSILYWVDKNNPRGEIPNNPGSDPQFYLWEYPVREWAKNQNLTENNIIEIAPATVNINILEPSIETIFKPDDTITVKVENGNANTLKQMDFFFKNQYLGSVAPRENQKLLTFVFKLDQFADLLPKEKITIKTYSNSGAQNVFDREINIAKEQ